jgi:uroporphyrinogen-III synthase
VLLLVTRPIFDAARTAARLRARGCDVLLASLLDVELIGDADVGSGPWGGLVMTSANAARAAAQHARRAELLRLPVFVVGRRTADAARAAGFGEVASANGNEGDLVGLIRACARVGTPLLYLAGEDRAGNLAAELAADGVEVHTVVVYRAAKALGFPSDVQAALTAGRIDGVLHFSRRSAEAYLDCARTAGALDRALAAVHSCLSRQVAEPLVAAGAARIRIAPRPEEAALIDVALLP